MTGKKVAEFFFNAYVVISFLGILCGCLSFWFNFGAQYMAYVPMWLWYAMIPGALIGLAVGLIST